MKILIVDDDHLVARSVARILKREGFDVMIAIDPVEASAYYGVADVVVSDWEMPNGGGARVLKESPIPVVIHSAVADLRAEFFVPKPSRIDMIIAEVERAACTAKG